MAVAFFEIFHRLPRLQKFCLDIWHFSLITGRVASAIEALCRSPHRTTLDLYNVKGFPIAALIASPSLRCLRLRNTSLFVNFYLFCTSQQLTLYIPQRKFHG